MTRDRSRWDRNTFLVKEQLRNNVLPCDPLFTRLLSLAHRSIQRPAIRDLNTRIEKTHAELLTDVLTFREVLRSSLRSDILQALSNGEEVYISLVAAGGYEFAVAILAILGLGAAASPFSPVQPVQEACYYVNKVQSVAVVCSTAALKVGRDLAAEIVRTTNADFVCVPVRLSAERQHIVPKDMVVASRGYRDLNYPGIVIFTSGTTGPPKGGVLPLAAITDGALSFAEQLRLQDTDTVQHLLPVHHATGIWVTFFAPLLAGACIEFKSGSFDPAWTWDRWREGGITYFSGVPTIYMRMMRHYQEVLSKRPLHELAAYREAASKLRAALCGTSALPKPINDFWTALMNGRSIIQRYGSTEQGVIFNMPFEPNSALPDGSVGEKCPGVDVRLSEGQEGEVLTKSFYMFSKYVHDPEATKNAFDAAGYFKSGDVARRDGSYFFIVGRASVDIIKSGGYKISALDVEREILALPYVDEVMVVGVSDEEYGQRVAAVVSLSGSEMARNFLLEHDRSLTTLKLDDLRKDVRHRLATYKLPTLLRVIAGEIPKGATNKVVKKLLGPHYFPQNYASIPEVQLWHPLSGDSKARL